MNEQIEAGARFLAEFQKYAPMQAAFWLEDGEDGGWRLCIASHQVTDENFDLAYGEVARLNSQMQDPWFDVFQVRLVRDPDPLLIRR